MKKYNVDKTRVYSREEIISLLAHEGAVTEHALRRQQQRDNNWDINYRLENARAREARRAVAA